MGTTLQDQPPAEVTTAEPVPVAILARTSTLVLQDPLASLRRQIRSCAAWLPGGWKIAGYYWDVESGGIDLEDRSQGDDWRQFADAGIPRDGGMADLLAEAKAPAPRFAAVVCEDIERSGRDTFNALKLEKELSAQGILLFATDEPASVEGANATTVLVRRVKQGVAEWFRLQIKEKAWKGLQEHSLAGWNIGPAPYGYVCERVLHTVPSKASQGRTRSRLAIDEVRGPIVTLIFNWRVNHRLSVPTIAWRLNADPAAYPPPPGAPGWAESTVCNILANPKYTGHMVFGRTRKNPATGKTRPVPPSQWLWSPEPTHPALTDRATWHAAQTIGAERGNTRDAEKPTTQPGTRYVLRSHVRHAACQHRMTGIYRPSGNDADVYIYYKCPYNPASPHHRAAHPDHPPTSVSIREDTLLAAITGDFLAKYVFGHDRAAMLAATLPATTAALDTQRQARAAALRKELARIDTAQAGLLTELEELGPDTSGAAA
ncbi:MAG: recombinase family protein, partial [Streptosporangiaceae bacterium]|nr:recombinase family protein [Streptosporangiaceae bacterium]